MTLTNSAPPQQAEARCWRWRADATNRGSKSGTDTSNPTGMRRRTRRTQIEDGPRGRARGRSRAGGRVTAHADDDDPAYVDACVVALCVSRMGGRRARSGKEAIAPAPSPLQDHARHVLDPSRPRHHQRRTSATQIPLFGERSERPATNAANPPPTSAAKSRALPPSVIENDCAPLRGGALPRSTRSPRHHSPQ